MKKTLALLALLVLALTTVSAASGCSLFGGKSAEEEKPPVIDGFSVVEPGALDAVAAAWYRACSLIAGVHVVSFDGENSYILAARGEKATGGFTVDLWGAEPGASGYTLTFRTKDPGPNDVVTQVISYPATLILTAHPADAITDVLFEGSETLPWPAGSPANAAIVPTEPLPFAEVNTTTLRIAGFARVFEGEFQYALEDGHSVLAQGIISASEGGPAWGNFSLDIQFAQPSSPGLMLRLFDESAMDGSIVFEADIPLNWTGN